MFDELGSRHTRKYAKTRGLSEARAKNLMTQNRLLIPVKIRTICVDSW
jgi:hypothetical protein